MQVSKYPSIQVSSRINVALGPSEVNCPEEVCGSLVVSVSPVVGVFQLMNTGPTFK